MQVILLSLLAWMIGETDPSRGGQAMPTANASIRARCIDDGTATAACGFVVKFGQMYHLFPPKNSDENQ
jgi:hypothetical protein